MRSNRYRGDWKSQDEEAQGEEVDVSVTRAVSWSRRRGKRVLDLTRRTSGTQPQREKGFRSAGRCKV